MQRMLRNSSSLLLLQFLLPFLIILGIICFAVKVKLTISTKVAELSVFFGVGG